MQENKIIICRNYWIKPVDRNLPAEVMNEAFQMNRLWNRFVELGLKNREEYNKVLTENDSVSGIKAEFDKASEELSAAHAALKKARTKYRSKTHHELSPYMLEYRRLKQAKQEAAIKLKQAKNEYKVTVKDKLKAISQDFNKKVFGIKKDAYDNYMHSGNAYSVMTAFQNAWQRGFKTGGFPKFHRFDGQASFNYWFGGGRKVERLFKENGNLFYITPYDTSAYYDETLSKRKIRKKTRTILTAKIGGVKVPFYINIHREMPQGLVKTAIITRKKQGTHIEWGVSFAIEVDKKHVSPACVQKTAAIDLGYRIKDGKMRIGVLISDDRREEIWMPDKIMNSVKYAQELQSVRDMLSEGIKKRVCEMLPADAPVELKSNWDKARQPRLIKIMNYMRETEHFFYPEMLKWFQKDKKLYNESRGVNARALRHRKNFFYNEAHRLCSSYNPIIIENLDLANMQRKNDDAEKDGIPDAAKQYRQLAALGEFIALLKYIASKTGTEIKTEEAAYTSLTCSACGHIMTPEDRSKLNRTCEVCGAVSDQDVNAAINLYRSRCDIMKVPEVNEN